jgi:hypothetical protein
LSTVCSGSPITLTANGGTGAVYEWGTGATVGQNIISGVTSASYTDSPSITTTYWVRRNQVSPCSGSTAGVSITITISNSSTSLVVADGDYIWQGANNTDLKNRFNWMVFASPNTYTIATADISSTKNVFIPKLSTCVNSAFPVVSQPLITSSNSNVRDITILEDAVLTVSDEDLDVFGNWTNNGLFDHNMGSIDASIICPIDEKKAELCPGYFGKIDLALPVFNYNFVGYVEKMLK